VRGKTHVEINIGTIRNARTVRKRTGRRKLFNVHYVTVGTLVGTFWHRGRQREANVGTGVKTI
jgi:hypothetical protein